MIKESIFSERKKEEPQISFGRSQRATANSEIRAMLQKILAGLEAIGPRLDAIERTLKQLELEKSTEKRR